MSIIEVLGQVFNVSIVCITVIAVAISFLYRRESNNVFYELIKNIQKQKYRSVKIMREELDKAIRAYELDNPISESKKRK